MIFSRDYSRAILTLRQDEGRFSADRRGIFGRAVVEVRSGRAKVMLYAQGIKNGCICSLYLVCQRGEEFIPMKAVLVNIKNGRAEVKWDFNPDNILGSGFKLEDVRVLAVLTEDGDSVLSAYFDKPVSWRREKVKAAEVRELSAEEKDSCDETPQAEEKDSCDETPQAEEKPQETEKPSEPESEKKRDKPTYDVDFNEMVNRFKKDLDELRKYAYMQRPTQEENQRCGLNLDVDHIFNTRDIFTPPFEGEGEYREINLRDLALIDPYSYKLSNNPTVRRCTLNGGLLLGRTEEGLLLCIPDDRSFKNWEGLGFDIYRPLGNGRGYRIMKIKKENLYENTKEKLDSDGA